MFSLDWGFKTLCINKEDTLKKVYLRNIPTKNDLFTIQNTVYTKKAVWESKIAK